MYVQLIQFSEIWEYHKYSVLNNFSQSLGPATKLLRFTQILTLDRHVCMYLYVEGFENLNI